MKNKWIYLVAVILLLMFTGTSSSADYVGVKKCKACHIKQYRSWKKTSMANAIESLKPGVKAEAKKKAGLDPDKDYTNDAACLKCHTTGYGKPGGFKSMSETPKLANVQCEGCHGPGADFRNIMRNKKFKLSEATAAGLVLPSESANNCMECHGGDSPFNEKVDPKYKFNIKEALKNTHKHFPLKYEH